MSEEVKGYIHAKSSSPEGSNGIFQTKTIIYGNQQFLVNTPLTGKIGDKYILPMEDGIPIDFLSNSLLNRPQNKVLFLEKNDQGNLVLIPLSSDSSPDTPLESPREFKHFVTPLSSGSYGSVYEVQPQNVVYKESKSTFGRDMMMEIGVYSMLANIICLPEYHSFRKVDDKMQIFLSKSSSNLHMIHQFNLDSGQKLQIFYTVCKCMKALASQGIIHGDIKPSNILILERSSNRNSADYDPHVQLIDFGLSQIEYDPTNPRPKQSCIQTRLFMAPEITLVFIGVLNKYTTYTNKVDIFSLGLTLCYLMDIRVVDDNGLTDNNYLSRLGKFLFNKNQSTDMIEYIYGKPGQSTESYKVFTENYGYRGNFADLLSGMLCMNPTYRIDYDEILSHPVFFELPDQFKQPVTLPIFVNDMPIIENIVNVWEQHDLNRPLYFDVIYEYALIPEVLALTYQLLDRYVWENKSEDGAYPAGNTMDTLMIVCMSIADFIFQPPNRLDIKEALNHLSISSKQFDTVRYQVLQVLDGRVIIPTIVSYRKHAGFGITEQEILTFYQNPACYAINLQAYSPNIDSVMDIQ